MKKRRTPSQAIGTAETNVKKTVAKSGALARIAAMHLRRPSITMGRLTIAGTSNSGAEAHAPQPSKLRTYSSIPSRDINGSQHTHRKAPGSRSPLRNRIARDDWPSPILVTLAVRHQADTCCSTMAIGLGLIVVQSLDAIACAVPVPARHPAAECALAMK